MRKYSLKTSSIILPTEITDIAYLAGIFDGEGNIYGQRRSIKSFARWQICIGNTDANLMRWLRKIGGSVTVSGKAGSNKRTKNMFSWKICGLYNVLTLLGAMLPFLLIKKSGALEAISDIKSHISSIDIIL